MEQSSTVILAVVGVLATCVGGLLWVIKYQFTSMKPAIEGLTKAAEKNTVAITKTTAATTNADKYLRARDGRDALMHKELVHAIGEIPKQIIKTGNITAKTLEEAPVTQTVEQQDVKVQTVRAVK